VEDERATVRRELADLDDSIPSGVVRVGSFASAVRALLLPLLSSLATTSPELEVIVEEAEERNALPRLRRGELDLVLMERDEHTLPAAPRGTSRPQRASWRRLCVRPMRSWGSASRRRTSAH